MIFILFVRVRVGVGARTGAINTTERMNARVPSSGQRGDCDRGHDQTKPTPDST